MLAKRTCAGIALTARKQHTAPHLTAPMPPSCLHAAAAAVIPVEERHAACSCIACGRHTSRYMAHGGMQPLSVAPHWSNTDSCSVYKDKRKHRGTAIVCSSPCKQRASEDCGIQPFLDRLGLPVTALGELTPVRTARSVKVKRRHEATSNILP